VLLVEDNPGDAELIIQFLEEASQPAYQVTHVETLGAALSLLWKPAIDAILLDLRLPDAIGAECVARVRAVAAEIPVVVLTGMDEDALAHSCLRSGAQDYFSKFELRPANLLRAIEYAIVRLEEVSQRSRADALQARLAAIVDSANDAIVSATLEGVITSWNPAAERIFGIPLARAIGAPAAAVAPLLAEFTEGARGAAGTPLRLALEGPQERTWSRPDGTAVTLSVVASVLRGRAGEPVGLAATCRDVSVQRDLETQLALADRMVSIGTLAAGVAHEINNPLAAVVANLALANRRLASLAPLPTSLDPLLDELRDAEDAALRVLRIAADLKRLSRAEEETNAPVDLPRAIEAALRIADPQIRFRARLVNVSGAVPLVEANESRLGQVLLNLLVNAAQAIPEGHPEENEIRVTTGVDDRGRVTVEVTDTGVGIPLEARGRIFAAFFTTKPVGVGTGLGLAISRRLVTSFGGELSFESQVGSGTTFLLALRPWAGPASQPLAVAVAAAPPARRGRVLVIDDEPALLRVLERLLRDVHDVTTTLDAGEALRWIDEGRAFDLILCDLMMPSMSGAAFYTAVKDRIDRPDERVVFMTGGAFTAETISLLTHLPNRHLEKPFDVERLRALANELVA
jgi:PAS domain S-box-containing protein